MGGFANGDDTRLQFWRRVREFAVPPSMIETATARRAAGDWAGACAAARVEPDLNLRVLAREHGAEVAGRVRADLRHLAPDLLRWHMPRIAPDGLLRPGLTVALARYGPVDLVARTWPAWADSGQRIGLALWDGRGSPRHPHPRPDRHFRLDLHRHLWDARRAPELARRALADWAAEAALLRAADGLSPDAAVVVRLGGRRWLRLAPGDPPRPLRRRPDPALPVLPHAATWASPDRQLLDAGLVDPAGLHPLVALALAGVRPPAAGAAAAGAGHRLVECRGERHRIGLVDGTLAALDHDPQQLRREELLAALGGPPLPCLRAIDAAHRHPECLEDVRARLDHGDTGGALAAVEALLGPGVLLRSGALRDALTEAAARRVTHGLFRAGLSGHVPPPALPERGRRKRAR